ncbi:MAG: hypothetical protein Unbinned664contig1000_12 [Prokaryotic dsDNA virus sp.]|nr:MAG: hypothetical protein Unbinned664contig1000_12 [Prokaryotic dsDNA virus sp.]|tara:strand:+ start:28827 stop:29330 length:504 start_codon:yes stop_codon:yes gene_type:complete
MTKKRRPVTEHSAIALAVTHLSDLDIENATGKSTSLYRQCSDPDISTHNISFIDAAKLAGKLIETGHAEHFTEALRNLIRSFSGEASHGFDDVDVIVSTMTGCQVMSEAIRASRCANGPAGRDRTPSEIDDIIGHAADLIAELQKTIRSLESERGATVTSLNSKEAC